MNVGLGGTEVLVLILIFFIVLPVANSIVFYRLGKKAGYNQGKAEALNDRNI